MMCAEQLRLPRGVNCDGFMPGRRGRLVMFTDRQAGGSFSIWEEDLSFEEIQARVDMLRAEFLESVCDDPLAD